jgi:carbonic anhydrase
MQSPIDISTGSVSDIDLPAIAFQYADTEFEWYNNGHTLEAEDGHPGTSTISVGGTAYELLQFHFHALSEHTIDGQHSAIELHLVHRASDTDLAVIGVMINEGLENPHFASLWSALPADASVAAAHISLNPADLLPATAEYYRYDGSLTTPNGSNPEASCAEIVNWHVMKDGIEMSAGQIEAFQAIFDHNYRPVQALNGRQVQG